MINYYQLEADIAVVKLHQVRPECEAAIQRIQDAMKEMCAMDQERIRQMQGKENAYRHLVNSVKEYMESNTVG